VGHAASDSCFVQIKNAAEKEMIEKKRKEAEDKSYITMMDVAEMQTNKEVAGKYESVEDMEDDFM
jgi:peptidyl-tRNA hydrolase